MYITMNIVKCTYYSSYIVKCSLLCRQYILKKMSLNEADFSPYLEENSPIPPDVVFLVQVKFRVNNFRFLHCNLINLKMSQIR